MCCLVLTAPSQRINAFGDTIECLLRAFGVPQDLQDRLHTTGDPRDLVFAQRDDASVPARRWRLARNSRCRHEGRPFQFEPDHDEARESFKLDPALPVSNRMRDERDTRAVSARSSKVSRLRVRSSRTRAATRATMDLTPITAFANASREPVEVTQRAHRNWMSGDRD